MISEREIVLRLVAGALMGGLIGLERQAHGRPAGFRTHMLVCVSSVLIMLVSEYYHHLSAMDPAYVRVDPARIAAGAITGIGFLGAGVIIKTGNFVMGLTTAACLWMVSAIGLAVGVGMYVAGGVSFVITVFVLYMLRMIERVIPRALHWNVSVTAIGGIGDQGVTRVLDECLMESYSVDYEYGVEQGELTYRVNAELRRGITPRGLIEALSGLENVKRVSIKG